MDKSGRLPSFKPPRDLTLSRGGVSRNRRTYTPNIPVPRGRSGSQGSASNNNSPAGVVSSGSTSQEPSTSSGNSPSTSFTDRRRNRGELVQSESIFGQGVGDPTLASRRLASASSSSSRGGGNRSSRGGGERRNYLGKAQLAEILKKREKVENEDDEDWMGGNFVEYSDDDEEDTINDISIPLSSYLHEERSRAGPSSSKAADAVLNAKLEANSFANIFHTTDKNEDKLLLIQLPSRLPVLDQSAAEASKSSSTNVEPTLESLAETIESLPEGPIGKIQILASGKSRFVMGENVFDLQHGASISFLQELASIDLEDNQIVNLGPITNKFILSPNLDVLLKL